MHIFSFAQLRCQHYIEVYKFSVHLHSHILRQVSLGLFPAEEPLAHVTALWEFMFYPPATPHQEKSR